MKLVSTILTMLVLVAAVPADAQVVDRPAGVHHRNDCRLALQVLASGEPHTRTVWARQVIVNCEHEGPIFFSAQWTAANSDTVSLRELIRETSRIRDARIYSVLKDIAQDRSRPDALRVSAMIVIAKYVDPGMVVDLTHLRPPARRPVRITFRGGSAVDVVQIDGAQPLGSITREALALLRRIGDDRSGEPQAIWYAAATLAHRVERAPGAERIANR